MSYTPLSESSREYLASAAGNLGNALGRIETALDGGGLEHLVQCLLDADAECERLIIENAALRAGLTPQKPIPAEAKLPNPEKPPVKPLVKRLAWPASDRWLRILVNVSGEIVNYPPAWFARDVVTDLEVIRATSSDPSGDWQRAFSRARAAGVRLIGTYISGNDCARAAEQTQYPDGTVHRELLPAAAFTQRPDPTWTRQPVNLSDPAAAKAFYELLTEAVLAREGVNIAILDNLRHPSVFGSTREWFPWLTQCAALGEARARLNARGVRMVINVAVAPDAMTDAEVDATIAAADGISLEMGVIPAVRRSPSRLLRTCEIYRRWLKAGMLVVLIPTEGDTGDGSRWAHAELLAGVALALREPGDALYVASPFWQAPPAWAAWPVGVGNPIGPPVFEGSTITRAYELAQLAVDLSADRVRWG